VSGLCGKKEALNAIGANMAGFFEVLRHYPFLSVALVVMPLAGGFVGAYLGFDNLSGRFANERRQQRDELREQEIKKQLDSLAIPVEALRRYEQLVEAQGTGFDLLRVIIAQYEQLQRAVTVREQFIGREDTRDRIAAAEHILKELRALLGEVQTAPGPGGQALIIKTAGNTFRVTFAVPMRVAPTLTFTGLPKDVQAHVTEVTNIGFAVVFTPINIPVDNFGFQADAEP
jgi:hypothetical protein